METERMIDYQRRWWAERKEGLARLELRPPPRPRKWRGRAPSRPDPAVSEKAWRREFGADYKARILREADPATAPGQLGALLRREGLSSSHLAAWRKQRDAAACQQPEGPQCRGAASGPRRATQKAPGRQSPGGCLRPASGTIRPRHSEALEALGRGLDQPAGKRGDPTRYPALERPSFRHAGVSTSLTRSGLSEHGRSLATQR